MDEYETLEDILEEHEHRADVFSSSAETCSHANAVEKSARRVCMDCGEELKTMVSMEREWRYFGDQGTKNPNRVLSRRDPARTIYNDVDHLGFSDTVVHLANQIFIEITGDQIVRGNPRKSLVFAVVFHAHKILGKPQSIHRLGQLFNVGRKISNRGLDYTNLNRSKSPILASNVIYITPECFIDEIMDIYKGTTAQREVVAELSQKLKNRSSKLNRAKPYSVAAAIVFYWMTQNQVGVSIKDFSQKCSLSELTINRIVKEIQNVFTDNKE